MTVLTIVFNVVLIPRFGTIGAAFGTIASSTVVAAYGVWKLFTAWIGHSIPSTGMETRPTWTIIRSLFRFGLPDRASRASR